VLDFDEIAGAGGDNTSLFDKFYKLSLERPVVAVQALVSIEIFDQK
jgi:hypothetical protein